MPTQQYMEPPQVMAQMVSHTRLPKLSFLKFRGDITKWNTYQGSFSLQYIITKEFLTLISSIILILLLTEAAATRAIQGLTLTEVNYEATVKLSLQENFWPNPTNPTQRTYGFSFSMCHHVLKITLQSLDMYTTKYVSITAVWPCSVFQQIITHSLTHSIT